MLYCAVRVLRLEDTTLSKSPHSMRASKKYGGLRLCGVVVHGGVEDSVQGCDIEDGDDCSRTGT